MMTGRFDHEELPPPAATTMVGPSLSGQVGSSIPCSMVEMKNNPVASFSGTGPWTLTINSMLFDVPSVINCRFQFTSIVLTSSVSISGPYAGSDSGVCGGVPAQLLLRDLKF